MALPSRKHPRLKDFDYSSNGAYFITICTKNRECLLGEVVGRGAFTTPQVELSDCGKIVEQYIKTIPGLTKYVIMPNHVHIIILIESEDGAAKAPRPTQSISTRIGAMKSLASKEAGFSIWQTSFHDRVIRSEKEYQKIWNYIDQNPLRWELDCFHPQNTL